MVFNLQYNLNTHPSHSCNLEIDIFVAAHPKSFQEIEKLYSKAVWNFFFQMLFLSNGLVPYYLLTHLSNGFKERKKND